MLEFFVILTTAIVFIFSKLAQAAVVTFWCEYTITVIIPIMSLIYKKRKTIGFYGLYYFACYIMLQIGILDALRKFLNDILNSL